MYEYDLKERIFDKKEAIIILIKKFWKEKSGLGIIEYVLLLSLLGVVVISTTPTLREQVGKIYEEQVHSTNNLNGMIDSENASRFDIEDDSLLAKNPNESVQNENGFETSKDPDEVTNEPDKKSVVKEVKNLTGIFEEEYSYNQDGYKGILTKTDGDPTSEVIEERNVVTKKDITKYVKGSTKEEFETLLEIQASEEGFEGILTPAGEIETIFAGLDETPKVISKNSGNVIRSIETHRTENEYIQSLFPESYLYRETLSFGDGEEMETGYSGTVNKVGDPTKVQIGQVSVPDYRYTIQNRDFLSEVDVTLTQESFNHKYISPVKGENAPNNPNTYPATYHYTDDVKEGLLNYVSKGSTKINTRTDVIDVTAKSTFSYPPGSTHNYNTNGYTGTLNAINEPYIISGSYTPPISKEETETRTSTSNNLPSTIYYDKSGYVGTLTGQGVTSETTRGGYWSETGHYEDRGYEQRYPADTYWVYFCDTWTHPWPCSMGQAGQYIIVWGYRWVENIVWVSDGREWVDTTYTTYRQSYTGTVTLPAVDTRQWSRDYAGSASKVIDTYEYHANYTGYIFNKDHKSVDITPNTIEYTDRDGYKGTLYKMPQSLKVTLKSLRNTQTQKTISNHKVYTPGYFPSATNTQNYDSLYNYEDPDKFYGSIRYIDKKTEFAYTEEMNHKEMNQTKTATTKEALENTLAYTDGAFSGILQATGEANVISGSYTPPITKEETETRTSTSNNLPATITSNKDGYIGTLVGQGVTSETTRGGYWSETGHYEDRGYEQRYVLDTYFVRFCDDWPYPYPCSMGEAGQIIIVWGYRWVENIVWVSDGREWVDTTYTTYRQSYTGNVTKPAVDTRKWARDYSGTVSETVKFYRHFANYSGTVKKANYLATYNYNVDYDGDIVKNILKPNYRYSQGYNGELTKETYNFIYEYRRKFSGTLFKIENHNIIEYTKQYEGIVEEVQ